MQKSAKEEEKFKRIEERLVSFTSTSRKEHQKRIIKNSERYRAVSDTHIELKQRQDNREQRALDIIEERFNRIHSKIEEAHNRISKSIYQKSTINSARAVTNKQSMILVEKANKESNLYSTYNKISAYRETQTTKYSTISRDIRREITANQQKNWIEKQKKEEDKIKDILSTKLRIKQRRKQVLNNKIQMFNQKTSYKKEMRSLHNLEIRDNLSQLKKGEKFMREMLTQKFINNHLPSQARSIADIDYQCEKRRLSALSIKDKEKALKCSLAIKRAHSQLERNKVLNKLSVEAPWKQYVVMNNKASARSTATNKDR